LIDAAEAQGIIVTSMNTQVPLAQLNTPPMVSAMLALFSTMQDIIGQEAVKESA